jgi:hypothetical protein
VSNALAFAAVTAVIKDLLDNALIDSSVSDAVGGPVTVSVLAPDHIETGDNEDPRLNLFLYHVVPNAALRNADLPARDARGRRRAAAPLALDLHYMLSAYGADDYEAEILLGYAMLMLHESPVLSRGAVRRALRAPSPVDGGILPPAVGALAASDLADQLELVRITQHGISADEMAKLWTAFQARYRPSAAYTASLVLLERREPTVTPLPVLSIGEVDPESGRARGVVVQPSLVPPYPALLGADPPAAQPAIRMGERLSLRGRALDAHEVAARFVHIRSGVVLELTAEPGAAAAGFTVLLPETAPGGAPQDSPLDPDNWLAGLYTVSAVLRGGGAEWVTNPLPLVLAPRIDAISASPVTADDDDDAPASVHVDVEVAPPIRSTQRVQLLVGSAAFDSEPLEDESAAELRFTVTGVPSGSQWLRLRVDDAESLLIVRAPDAAPAFDPTQQVVIP